MLSNSSGLLRYGPETVLTGLKRFLPPVREFNLAGHSIIFSCLKSPFGRRYEPDTVFATKRLDIGDDLYFGQLYVGNLMNGPILEPSKRPKIEHLKKSK